MPPAGRTLDLPPPFRPVALREAGDAVAYAAAHAAGLGAGALVFVGRFDLAEFAVVLEPEESLAEARLVFYPGMLALADTLAALAPPETPIAMGWPDALLIDGGLVGGGCLAWPPCAGDDATPDWLVFGAVIRLVSPSGEAGLHPLSTALRDEGFGDVGAERFIEAFARHLMAALDRWREGDFAGLSRDYLARLPREPGLKYAIDAAGDLHVERPRAPAARCDLRAALAAPSWRDPAGGVRR